MTGPLRATAVSGALDLLVARAREHHADGIGAARALDLATRELEGALDAGRDQLVDLVEALSPARA